MGSTLDSKATPEYPFLVVLQVQYLCGYADKAPSTYPMCLNYIFVSLKHKISNSCFINSLNESLLEIARIPFTFQDAILIVSPVNVPVGLIAAGVRFSNSFDWTFGRFGMFFAEGGANLFIFVSNLNVNYALFVFVHLNESIRAR